MQADRKAPYTIDSYTRGARYYLTWCAAAPVDAPPPYEDRASAVDHTSA